MHLVKRPHKLTQNTSSLIPARLVFNPHTSHLQAIEIINIFSKVEESQKLILA